MLRLPLAIALTAILTAPALANCPANNRYTLNFPDFAAQQLDYATSYTTPVLNPRGQSVTMGLSFSTFNLSSNQVAGVVMPQISTFINDGGTTNTNLVIGGVFPGRTKIGRASCRERV